MCFLKAYRISQAVRGKCVIFNMETVGTFPQRQGTRVDQALLTQLFEQLNFDVIPKFNCTAQVTFCSFY